MEHTEKFKTALEKEKSELIENLKQVGRINPENPKDWEPTPGDEEVNRSDPDPNVAADAVEAYEERSGVEVVLENRLGEVNDALDRIKKDTFGVCEVCGETIEDDRLNANASARTCKKHIEADLK